MISKSEKPQFQFLRGGGEMGEIIRGKNWKNSPIGPPETWPKSLKFAISTMLHTAFPNFIFWGKEYYCFYNDAYRPSLGIEGKHPFILGQEGEEAWPEIWDTIHPLLESVWKTGKPTWSENQLIPFYRNGQMEDIYWTFSYSALFDEEGNIGGILTTCVETTEAVENLSKLKVREDELKFAIDAADLGTWDYDPINNQLKTNRRLKEWFGLPPDKGIELSQATDAIIEKDRDRVDSAIRYALDPTTSGKYDISYTVRNKRTGEELYVRAVGRAWCNERGCYRFNGTLQDNTELREAETERSQLTTLVETSHELIGLSDMKGNIEYANPAAMEMMGWDDITEKTVKHCVFPEDLKVAEEAMAIAVDKGFHSTEMRLWNLKTQQPFWILWNAFVIRNGQNGEKIGLGTVSTNIEKRKAQERELENALKQIREEKEKFSNLVKQAPVGIGIVRGQDHVFELLNDKGLRIMGGNEGEIIGKSIFDILVDGREVLEPLIDKVYETRKSVKRTDFPVVVDRENNKQTFYFNFVYEPLLDEKDNVTGIIIVAEEVTESVKLKHVLQENEKQFRKMIMESPIPMAIYKGENLIIEMANSNMLQRFMNGRKEEDVIGKPLVEVFPELKNQKYPELLRKVIRTGEPYSEKESYALLRGDTELVEFYLDFNYKALAEIDGKVSGVIVTASDVTEKVLARKKLEAFSKELESQVQERTAMLSVANEKLELSVKELETTNADLESFAYVSSHDLQEPLRKIQMFASRIADRENDNLSENGQRNFQKITVAADRMRNLITDLLAFSRANTGKTDFVKTELKEILDQVLDDLSEKIGDTGAKIEADDLFTAMVVPFQMRQVFQNLIENAIKFSRKDVPPVISISSEITTGKKDDPLGLEAEKKYGRITVKDNGIGFDPKFAGKIFDVFQRLHGKLDFQGTGIGLAIVRKIMLNHNAVITASSGEGEGATFDMYLPLN